MSTLTHSPAAVDYRDDSYELLMTLASELGHLPSDAEFEAWSDSLFPDVNPDEAPELDLASTYEPEPEDSAWLAADNARREADPIAIAAADGYETTDPARAAEYLEAMDRCSAIRQDRATWVPTDPARRKVFGEMAARGVKPISGGSPEAQPAVTLEDVVISLFDGGASEEGVEMVKRLHELTGRLIRDYGLSEGGAN